MKSLLLVVLLTGFLVSCSNKEESAFEEVKSKICGTLQEDNSPEGIKKAGNIYKSEFSDLFELKEDEEAQYLTKLRSCFSDMGFKKQLRPYADNPLSGSLSDYLKIQKTDVELILKNPEAPAFSIDFIFEGIAKRQDEKEYDIEGSISIYDSEKELLMTYNLYPVPDFYNTINRGNGDFKFTTYLDAVWYPYSKEPFEEALKYMMLMNEAEFYSVQLGVKGDEEKDKKKDDDKEYHEMLDNLEIMNAAK